MHSEAELAALEAQVIKHRNEKIRATTQLESLQQRRAEIIAEMEEQGESVQTIKDSIVTLQQDIAKKFEEVEVQLSTVDL